MGQSSLQKINESRFPNTFLSDQPTLFHVEDVASTSYWNTLFRVKVNLHGKSFDATLDTGASLSAIRAEIVQTIHGGEHAFETLVHASYSAHRWDFLLPSWV